MKTRRPLFSWGAGRRAAPMSSTSRPAIPAIASSILPPNVDDYGRRPFSEQELRVLAGWLADASWPRGTLSIAGLEGYLVALTVLPLAAHPGMWLPPIWNDSGWRLAAPIRQPDPFHEFMELTCGFMRRIEGALIADPGGFRSVCEMDPPAVAPPVSQGSRDWAQGFSRAIGHAHRLYVPSGTPEYRALAEIALCINIQAAAPAAAVSFARLRQAIGILVAGRTGGHSASPAVRGPSPSRAPRGRHVAHDDTQPPTVKDV